MLYPCFDTLFQTSDIDQIQIVSMRLSKPFVDPYDISHPSQQEQAENERQIP